MKKRGQVSLFALMGMVILLGVLVVIYIEEKDIFFKPSIILPAKVRPVVEFVENCISDYGSEALFIAGQQGGWIELPAYIENNPGTYIDFGGMKVPYWYYDGRVIAPTLEKIEENIAQYMDDELPFCLNNLTDFEKEFDINIVEGPSTEVSLSEKDVIFTLKYLVSLIDKTNRTKTNIANFETNIPVAFKEVYDFANAILEAENNQLFFEKATIDLMGLNKDVPFTGLNFKCINKPMEWRLSDVSRELREMLARDIYRVRVKNANYVPFMADEEIYEKIAEYDFSDTILVDAEGDIHLENTLPVDVPPDSYDYFHYFWDIGVEPSNLKAAFNYRPDFGLYINARPSEQGIMKSNVAKGTSYLNFLCVHIYHFSYDVKYPIEVMVRDDDSLDGEGFVLRYGLPVMIDHNTPNREKTSQSVFDYVQSKKDFSEDCEDRIGSYTFTARGYDEYLYDVELDNVSFVYNCLMYQCPLGNTQFIEGSYYGLKTGLPKGCFQGILEASKPGYLTTRQQVTAEDMEAGFMEIRVPLMWDFNISVVKKRYNKNTGMFGVEVPFNDTATISLRTDAPAFEEFTLLEENNTIKILVEPVITYNLEMTILDGDSAFIGGFKGDWIVSYEDFKDKSNIVFKAFEYFPKPITDEEMLEMYIYLEEGDYSEVLKPEFR